MLLFKLSIARTLLLLRLSALNNTYEVFVAALHIATEDFAPKSTPAGTINTLDEGRAVGCNEDHCARHKRMRGARR